MYTCIQTGSRSPTTQINEPWRLVTSILNVS